LAIKTWDFTKRFNPYSNPNGGQDLGTREGYLLLYTPRSVVLPLEGKERERERKKERN
jgi:hypothetical protein